MPTVEESIEVALFGGLVGMTLDGSPPLAMPNEPFPGENPDGSKKNKPKTWVEVTHLTNRNERHFMKGENPHLRQGILQMMVYTPLNNGRELATTLGGEVAAHFPAGRKLHQDGLTVTVQSAPDRTQAAKTPDGVAWALMVSIRYECFA